MLAPERLLLLYERPSLLVRCLLSLRLLELMLQMQLLQLLLLCRQLVTHPRLELHYRPQKHLQLVMVLPLDLLLDSLREPEGLLFLLPPFLLQGCLEVKDCGLKFGVLALELTARLSQ